MLLWYTFYDSISTEFSIDNTMYGEIVRQEHSVPGASVHLALDSEGPSRAVRLSFERRERWQTKHHKIFAPRFLVCLFHGKQRNKEESSSSSSPTSQKQHNKLKPNHPGTTLTSKYTANTMFRLLLRRTPRPLVVSSWPGYSTAAAVGDHTTQNHHVWLAGLVVTAGTVVYSTKTLCDPVAAKTESPSNPPQQQEEEEEEEDPYENLPEDDEPTDCSMCNTFRQGPCRPFWRKLERCFKDHEGEENGATQCMRYFQPHQSCLMDYTNLYQLVSLEMKQELVRDAELSVDESERRTWSPAVDWDTWISFVGDAGLDYCETVQKTNEDGELLPLWKRLPENKEPVLLTIPVPLPKEESGMILKIAYVVDQDGMVLGLTYNKEYGALIEKAEAKAAEKRGEPKKPESDKPAPQEESDTEQSDSTMFDFDFFLLPGETKSVRICGLYAENPVDADPKKEILDALLFKSQEYVLKDIVDKAS